MATTSPFLTALNQNAASHHPQADYRTIGGDHRGLEFNALDLITFGFNFSLYPDDGLVDLVSANPSASNPPPNNLDLGALQQGVLHLNHTEAVREPEGFQLIQQFLP